MVSHAGVVVIFAIMVLPFGSADLVDSTCRKTPNYGLCTTILRADPKSSSADVTGLALIAVASLKSKSTSAVQTINGLLRTRPGLRAPLNECLKHYNFLLKYDITQAVEALTKGNPKFAEQSTRDAAFVVQECEDGFGRSVHPISIINKAARDVADIATAIVILLL